MFWERGSKSINPTTAWSQELVETDIEARLVIQNLYPRGIKCEQNEEQ